MIDHVLLLNVVVLLMHAGLQLAGRVESVKPHAMLQRPVPGMVSDAGSRWRICTLHSMPTRSTSAGTHLLPPRPWPPSEAPAVWPAGPPCLASSL
jgi:hypothetical protein